MKHFLVAESLRNNAKRFTLALATTFLLGHSALADTTESTWTGGSANWAPGTWSNGTPSATISAVFNNTANSAGSTVALGVTPATSQGIWVTGGTAAGLTTISGTGAGILTITGTATLDSVTNAGILLDGAGNNSLTITAPVTVSNSTNLDVNNTGTLTLSGGTGGLVITAGQTITLGGVSGSNINISSATTATTGAITVNTAGTVTLSGNNLNTGATTLTSGTLVATTSAGALGLGTLSLGGGILDLTNVSGTNLSFNRNTTVTGNTQITSDVTVASTAGNTYTMGTLSIGAQTLTIAGGPNVGSGTAGVTFGVTTITGNTNFTINNPTSGSTVLTLGAVGSANVNTIALATTGTGTLTLATAAGTIANGTTVSVGSGITLNLNIASALGAAVTNVSDSGAISLAASNNLLSLTGSGGVSSSVASTLTISNATADSYGGVIANGAAATGLTKAGVGTLTLTNANTYNGATTVNNGTLVLNETTGSTIAATSALALGGGTLSDIGTSGTTQTFAGTTVNSGGSVVSTSAATGHVVALGAITRNAGGALNFTPFSTTAAANGSVTTTQANVNGILGGYATLNGTNFAVGNGTVAGLTSYNLTNSTNDGFPTDNDVETAGVALTGNMFVNTLTISDTGNNTLALGANNLTFTYTSATSLGGLLYAGNGGGGGSYSITGAGLVGTSSTTGELVVNVNTGATLTISAPVVTSGATAGLLTKAGGGMLVLTNTNVYTGATTVDGGTLQAGNGVTGTIGAGASTVAPGATLAFDEAAGSSYTAAITDNGTVTGAEGSGVINTLSTGVISGVGGFAQTGSGTTTLSGANTYTGGTIISNGTVNINGTGALGATTGGGTNGAITLNGGAINNTSGAGVTLSANSPITLGGSFAAFAPTSTSISTSINNLNLGTGAITNAGNNTITLNGMVTTLTLGGIMTNTEGANQTTTVNGAGDLLSLGGYNLSNSGTAYTDVINGSGNVTITGVVKDSSGAATGSGLTYSGTGTLTLGGADTYTGTTSVSSGTLNLTGSLTGSNVSITGTGVITSAGIINGTGVTFTQSSTGTSTLGGTNTYTGATTISAGTVIVSNVQGLGNIADTVNLNGGTLDLAINSSIDAYTTVVGGNATIVSDRSTAGAGVIHLLGGLTIGADTLTATSNLTNVTSPATPGRVEFGTATSNLTLTGNATLDAENDTLLVVGASGTGPSVAGNFNLTVQSADGTGIVSLRGNQASTRVGTTTFQSGLNTLNGSVTNILGNPVGSSLVLNGGSLDLQTSSGIAAYSTTVGGNFILTSNSATTQTLGPLSIGAFTLTTGSSATTGDNLAFGATTLTGNATLNVTNGTSTGTSTLTLGAVGDGGLGYGLTKTGFSTLTLNAQNTYTGTTTVNGGTLVLSGGGTTGSIHGTSSSALVVGGATVSYTTVTSSTQTFNGLTVNAGYSNINAAATDTIALGAITSRATGGQVNFTTTTGTITTTASNDATGILGDWATVNSGTSLNYAKNNGSNTIAAYSGGTTLTSAGANSSTTNYTLAAGATTTLSGIFTGNTLQFTANAAQVLANGGNNITLNGLMNSGTGGVTISGAGNLVIGANNELVIFADTAATTISSAITGSGGSLTYGGPTAGTLTLSGANTYTGTTYVNAGTLSTTGGSLTGSNVITSGAGIVSGTGTINGAGVTFTQGSSGTSTLSGANTYTGATTVNGGTLAAGIISNGTSSGAFGFNSAVVMANAAGATLSIGTFNTQIGSLTGGGHLGGNVTIGATTTLTIGGDNTSPGAYSGVISGVATSNVTKIGTGTLTLNGNNAYSGTTTLSNGTLVASTYDSALGTGALSLGGGVLYLTNPSGTNLGFSNNTTVTANVQITSDVTASGAGNTYTLGTLSIGAQTLSIVAGGNVASGTAGVTFGTTTLTNNAVFDTGPGTNLTLGAMGGAFAFTAQDSGTITLAGTSTRVTATGTTNLTGGTLNLNNLLALNASANTGALNLSGGTLGLNVTAGGTYAGTTTTVSGNATVVSNVLAGNGGAMQTLGTLSIGAQTLTINGGANVTAGTAGVTFGATTITGASAFAINNPTGGGSTLLVLGALTSASGSNSITLSGNGALSLATADPAGITSGLTVTVGSGTTLNLNNATALGTAVTNVADNGAVALGAATNLLSLTGSGTTSLGINTLTITNASADSYSGNISGTGGLTAAGAGTLTLSGTSTYTGLLTISGGGIVNATTASLDGSSTVNGITFSGSGGTLQAGTGGISTGKAVTLTVAGTFDTNGNNSTISGNITGAGSFTVVDSGAAATLTLSGANTFTGGLNINVGTVQAGSATGLGAGLVTIGSVGNSANLDLNGQTVTVAALATAGTAANQTIGNSSTSANGVLNYAGTVGTGTSTFGGVIQDVLGSGTKKSGVTVSGGKLVLSGVNTYTGPTTISGGVLQADSSTSGDSLGASGNINFGVGGGALQLTSADHADYSSRIAAGASPGAVSIDVNGQAVTFATGLTGNQSGGFTLSDTAGGGTLTFSAANAYTGTTTITAGTLLISGSGTLGVTTNALIVNGGTLNLGSTSQTVGPVTITGLSTIQSGTLTGTSYAASPGFGATDTVSATLAGSGGLSKSGLGTLVLSGANTFTGATAINAGIIDYQNSTAFGANSAITVASLATAQTTASGGSMGLKISGIGAIDSGGTGALENVSGTNSYSGLVTLGAAASISSDAGTLNLTNTGTIYGTATGFGLTLAGAGNGSIAGIINGGTSLAAGAGTLTVTGTGTWTLSGANTYTGTTTVNNGGLTLNFAAGGTTPTTNIINNAANTSALSMGGAGGTLSVNGIGTATNNSQRFASTTFAGGDNTLTITTTNSSNGVSVNLGALTFSGGVVNFVQPTTDPTLSATNGYITSTGNTAAGIIGGYATVNGTDWAALTGGVIQAYTAYTSISATGGTVPSAATDNVQINSAGGGGNDTLANGSGETNISTLMQSSTTASTIAIGSGQTLNFVANGGIFLTASNAGGNGNLTIGNTAGTGTVNAGGSVNNTAGNLYLTNDSSSALLTINSNVTNNGTGAVDILVSGTGTTVIAGNDSQTGTTFLNGGLLQVTGTLSGATAALTVNGGTLDLELNTESVAALTINGPSTIQDGNLNVTSVTANNGLDTTATVSANVTGSGALSKAGAGTLILSGTDSIGAGGTNTALTVSGGVLNIQNSYTTNGSGGITISSGAILDISSLLGSLTTSAGITVNGGGEFLLDDRGAGNESLQRVSTGITITLANNSLLVFEGTNDNSNSTPYTQATGSITLGSGISTISIVYNSNTSGVDASLKAGNTLSRTASQGGIALVNGIGLGSGGSNTGVPQLILNGTPTLVGTTAGGTTGINAAVQNTKIVPYLLGESGIAAGQNGTQTGTANTFLTYNATTGLRPLNPTQEFENNAIVSGDNTYITSATTAANTTSINSLVINGGNLSIAGNQILTDASAALLFVTGNSVAGPGTLALGSSEGIFTANAGVNATISANITGSGGVTVYGGSGSTLDLAGAGSTYTGTTSVAGGAILLIGANGTATSGPLGTSVLGISPTNAPGIQVGTVEADNQARSIGNEVVNSSSPLTIAGSNNLTFTGAVNGVAFTDITFDNNAMTYSNTATTTYSGIFSMDNAGAGQSNNSGGFINVLSSASLVLSGPIQDNNVGNRATGDTNALGLGYDGPNANITIGVAGTNSTNGFGAGLAGSAGLSVGGTQTYDTLTLAGGTPLGATNLGSNGAGVFLIALTNNEIMSNGFVPTGGSIGNSDFGLGFAGSNNLTLSGSFGNTVQFINMGAPGATLTFSGTVTSPSGVLGGTGNTDFSSTSTLSETGLSNNVWLGFSKTGLGTLTLSGVNNVEGNMSVSGGTLVLDNSTNNTNKLAQNFTTTTATALTLSGVNLQLNGGSGAFTQTLGNGSALVANTTTTGAISGATVIPMTNTSGILANQPLTGTNIPANDFVVSIIANTSITLSAGTSGAITSGQALTFNETGVAANGTTLGGGQTSVSQTTNTNETINFGTITRAVNNAGTINFATGSSYATNTNTAYGIIGGWATINGTDWAVANGSGSVISALGSYDSFGTPGTNKNILLNDSFSGAGTTINTLKITTDTGSQSLNLTSGTLTINSGGLLFTGANAYTITGGTLQAASSTTDLILYANGAGTLTIGSIISGGTDVLTKTGSGDVILSNASNSYSGTTYISQGTLTVSASGDLGTGTLTFNGGTLETTAGFSTSRAVGLGSNGGTFQVDTGTLIESGVVSGGSNVSPAFLTKTGAGTLQLSGNNTFYGPLTVSAGTLEAGVTGTPDNTAFGPASTSNQRSDSPVLVNGGTLDINGSTVALGNLTLSSGSIIDNAGTGTLAAYSFNLQSGTVGAALIDDVVNVGGDNSIDLYKTTSGTVTLTGNNTYSGATQISGGTLQIGNGGSTGTLGTANVTMSGGSTLVFDRSDTAYVVANAISDLVATGGTAGSVSQIGSGTTTLTGNNSFTGGLTISNGTVSVASVSGVGVAQPLGNGIVTLAGTTSSAPGTLQYTGNTWSPLTPMNTGTLTQAIVVTPGDWGTISNTGGSVLTLTGGISKNGSVLNFSGGQFVVASVISGSNPGSDMNVVGNSTVTLTNADTYNGPTSVSGNSTLITAVASALPTANAPTYSVLTLGAATDTRTTQTTNTVDLDGTSQTVGGLVDIPGTAGTNNFAAINQVVNSNGVAPYTTAGAGGSTLTVSPLSGVSNTFGGILGGSGASNNFSVNMNAQDSTGTQILTGANTYSGTTTITQGTLQLGNGGTTGSLATSSAITDNGNFTINRSNAVSQGTDFSASPINGNGSFTQAGTGKTTLTAANSYIGGTTVSAGTLYVNNTSGSGTGSGAVAVNSGGTLAGSGTITTGSGVAINAGGTLASGPLQTLAPAVTGPGLTMNNTAVTVSGTTLNPANLTFDLGAGNDGLGGTPGPQNFANPITDTTYMTLSGTSTINFSGTDSVSLVDELGGGNLSLRENTPYLLIHATSGSDAAFSGLVTELNGVLSLDQNGYVVGVGSSTSSYTTLAINQYAADGMTPLIAPDNYVGAELYLFNGNLEVVPEPGTWALMLGGLALLVFIQSRRRKSRLS